MFHNGKIADIFHFFYHKVNVKTAELFIFQFFKFYFSHSPDFKIMWLKSPLTKIRILVCRIYTLNFKFNVSINFLKFENILPSSVVGYLKALYFYVS